MKYLVRTTLLLSLMWLFSTSAQVMIDDFDASDSLYQLNIEGPASQILVSTNTTDKMQGTGALDMNARIGAFNAWGSYAQLIYRTDSTDVMDWSVIGDSLSIWIKVRTAPTMPQNMVFRIHIADRPTPSDPLEEYLYENVTVVDAVHDWYNLRIPLKVRTQTGGIIPDSTGFILPPDNWGFSRNNLMLDRDKIVGYNIGLITTTGAADSLVVSFDAFERFGVRAVPFIFFNGRVVSNFLSQFTWGQSTLEVEQGTGSLPGKNSLKWTQGNEWNNGWTGAGWDIAPSLNMAGAWALDSLKFKMKAPAGTGALRFQFESPIGKKGLIFTPTGDDQWNSYSFALKDFVLVDNSTAFDSSVVTVFQVMAEASGVAGRVIYMDDLWTGNPIIDVIAPDKVLNIAVSPGSFTNTITWDDVPGETGEVYSVYYSTQPITDVTNPGVEVVKLKVAENVGLVDHVLIAPKINQNVTYYYAVVCGDAAGNLSPVSDPTAPATNMAKGVTVIHPSAPVNFAADGDLSDWAGITPFRMFKSDGSGYVVTNTTVTNDADLSVLAYVAMDNDYLYVAFDVTDNIVATDTTKASYLIDSPDLFIGLYDWHGASHTNYKRGAEPDYHYRFGRNAVLQDNSPGGRLLTNGVDADYYWNERFSPPGYVVEAKLSFAAIAALGGGDNLFTPVVGKRIPIDFAVNDADATGEREGIMTYSPNNEDLSYQDVSRWVHTWIGDQWVVGVEDEESVVKTYSLFQNYPNPFNPTTQIRYSLEQSGFVSLKVYDLLGREVANLVSTEQNAGTYSVRFDASSLSSGIYFYKIESGSFVKTNKMILMK